MRYKAVLWISVLGALRLTAASFAAESKPSRQVVWENTVAAAKKEGRLNLYVGRYGSEPANSRRIDIPKDMLPAASRLVEGRRYYDFTDPKYADMTPVQQLAKEFMKGREAK